MCQDNSQHGRVKLKTITYSSKVNAVAKHAVVNGEKMKRHSRNTVYKARMKAVSMVVGSISYESRAVFIYILLKCNCSLRHMWNWHDKI